MALSIWKVPFTPSPILNLIAADRSCPPSTLSELLCPVLPSVILLPALVLIFPLLSRNH